MAELAAEPAPEPAPGTIAEPSAKPVAVARRPDLALVPVLAIGAVAAAVLLLLANRYGFHRDELYFIVAGRHPDWGYVDQPPLTPLLSAAAVELLGLSPLAVRILPAISVAVVILLGAALAREFGGGRRAQILAAVVVAGSWALGLGHLGSTATYDLLVWMVITWLVVRLLAGDRPWLWLLVGAAAGVGLQNKHLVVLLLVGLLAGVLVARRWELLRSSWLWAGAGLAMLIWAPNLIWQAANGFPQLAMSEVIADRSSPVDTVLVIPFQLILAGPLLWPVLFAGLWWLLRSPAGQPWRAVGWAYLVVLVITLGTQGQLYYPAGLIPAILAAGALPFDAWLRAGRRRLRAVVAATVAALSIVSGAVVTLPVLPPATVAETPIPDIYPETAEQIGWPELVATVEEVAAGLPAADQARAVVLTLNYGEAGALTLLGGPDLPPVYSGHNSFADWGPPADERDLVILVGHWRPARMALWGECDRQTTIDNPAGIDNEERGAGVWVCTGLPVAWSELWDEIRALG